MFGDMPMRFDNRASSDGAAIPVTEVTKIAPKSLAPIPAPWSALHNAFSPSSNAWAIHESFASPQVCKFK